VSAQQPLLTAEEKLARGADPLNQPFGEYSMPPERIQESPAAMFERLARDPNASVEKIERLMALWERNEARHAEMGYNTAMSEAQKEMRPIATDAENPETRSKYASYAALDRALRPIYTKHGFALSYDTGDTPLVEHVRMLCKVTHISGHAEVKHIDIPADGKGPKGGAVMTKTHATGSATTYGMRYLLKMIFNVAIGEGDDDGNEAGRKEQPDVPDGYNDWLEKLQEGAMNEGFPAFSRMWNDNKTAAFRTYLARTAPQMLENIKKTAREVSGQK
jgi:hypothetical protein